MKPIAFARADLGPEEIAALTRVVRSGWLTIGKETFAFEQEFAKFVGAREAIAVSSATAALFLGLQALGVESGDEVIVPSLTFSSTANVVVHCGAKVVFADVDPVKWTLDPVDVARKITKKTRAIIPVHYAGRLAKLPPQPVAVLEDSAHRIEPRHRTKNMVAYSFYATKNLTTGEGGIITTPSKRQAAWLRKARLHGISRDAWKRYDPKHGAWRYNLEFPGWKCNLTDLMAALGRVQLAKLERLNARRNAIVTRYNKGLGLNNQGNHLYPILVSNRNRFMEYMRDQNVQCSVHFLPVHQMSCYRAIKTRLPVTEYIGKHVATLPLHPLLTDQEVDRVITLTKAFPNGKLLKTPSPSA